jgi:hypothetical protein
MHPRLLAADIQRIDEAEAHLAAATPTDLAVFVNRKDAPGGEPPAAP